MVVKTSMKFLKTDSTLLTRFVNIIIPQTSVCDTKGVIHVFDCLGEWFRVFKESSIPLPLSFDFTLLVKCFDIVVATDHHMYLNLLLIFIYNYARVCSVLPKLRKVLFGDRFLGEWFFHFFLHWDAKIRWFFFQVLTFQV